MHPISLLWHNSHFFITNKTPCKPLLRRGNILTPTCANKGKQLMCKPCTYSCMCMTHIKYCVLVEYRRWEQAGHLTGERLVKIRNRSSKGTRGSAPGLDGQNKHGKMVPGCCGRRSPRSLSTFQNLLQNFFPTEMPPPVVAWGGEIISLSWVSVVSWRRVERHSSKQKNMQLMGGTPLSHLDCKSMRRWRYKHHFSDASLRLLRLLHTSISQQAPQAMWQLSKYWIACRGAHHHNHKDVSNINWQFES